MKINPAIQAYCENKGYADFVCREGLEYLVPKWEKVAKEVEHYPEHCLFEEYLNDLSCR